MDEQTAKTIQGLRNEVGDLQLLLWQTLAEVKALKALSTALWEKQNIEMADGRTISEVLQLLKGDILNEGLSKLADADMNLASKLNRRMEQLLKKYNPPDQSK